MLLGQYHIAGHWGLHFHGDLAWHYTVAGPVVEAVVELLDGQGLFMSSYVIGLNIFYSVIYYIHIRKD